MFGKTIGLELSLFAYCKYKRRGFIGEGRVVFGILGRGGKGYYAVWSCISIEAYLNYFDCF